MIIDNIFDVQAIYDVTKFIKAWLTLKVFNAELADVLISYHDGNETGVAAYRDMNRNRISQDVPFTLENSICGFGVRSGFGSGNYVHYANSDHWLKPSIIDTPFDGINYFPNADVAERKPITEKELEQNKTKIDEIVGFILGKQST